MTEEHKAKQLLYGHPLCPKCSMASYRWASGEAKLFKKSTYIIQCMRCGYKEEKPFKKNQVQVVWD
jgi:predicted nucleic-acid-binding Zn-ribbon protein